MDSSDASQASVLRFGVFELDCQAGELRKSGRLIHLPPQPCKILALLASHPGQVITREDIRRQIWGDETFVEFEQGLNHCIRQIRTALGDDAETPRYIKTLPRRGYRFIAPLDGGSVAPPATETVAVGRWRRTLRIVAISTAIVASILAVLLGLNVAGIRKRLTQAFGTARQQPLQIHSIAVLPLEDLSGDPNQEYFADGMTEELITTLDTISALRVISRTSVMGFKGTRKPLPQIAKELNVDAIVEGSVMRSGDRVRITAQLIQANPEKALWAQTYERDLRDVLALQSNVAQAIAGEVQIKLTPQEQRRVAGARPTNPEAYDAYIRGRRSLEEGTKDAVETSIQYFKRAIKLDPGYAAPYAGLADAYSAQGYFMVLRPKVAYPLAKEWAAKALAVDENSAEAYASLCNIRVRFDWDWKAAERDCTRAVELNPNSAVALHYAADYYLAMGRMEKGLELLKRSLERDPLSPAAHDSLAWGYYLSRRNDEAIAEYKKSLALDPNYPGAWIVLGHTYLEKKMYREAIQAYKMSAKVVGGTEDVVGLGNAYARAGQRTLALKELEKLKHASKHHFVPPGAFAWIYVGLGDKDQAFYWLGKAFEERDTTGFPWIKVFPAWDPLRSDPRYKELMRRMNFPRKAHD